MLSGCHWYPVIWMNVKYPQQSRQCNLIPQHLNRIFVTPSTSPHIKESDSYEFSLWNIIVTFSDTSALNILVFCWWRQFGNWCLCSPTSSAWRQAVKWRWKLMKQYWIIIDSLSQALGAVKVRFVRQARELRRKLISSFLCLHGSKKN